jgi:hypothetical protein
MAYRKVNLEWVDMELDVTILAHNKAADFRITVLKCIT